MTKARGERLIVFTRYPVPGLTKTRLIPALGATGAAELHRQMATRTLAEVDKLSRTDGLETEVRFEGGSELAMGEVFGTGRTYRPQGDGDLGARLTRAVADAFGAGGERVVVVGTDCPDLTADLIASAFDHLRGSDLVLGPAVDGGYYLIGLRRVAPSLFSGISWGTGDVLEATLGAARRAGMSVELLRPLADVDRPEDLSADFLGRSPRCDGSEVTRCA